MAEFETTATLEQEIDIDIDFNDYTLDQKLRIIGTIVRGDVWTFKDVPVILEGETTVEIEPAEWY